MDLVLRNHDHVSHYVTRLGFSVALSGLFNCFKQSTCYCMGKKGENVIILTNTVENITVWTNNMERLLLYWLTMWKMILYWQAVSKMLLCELTLLWELLNWLTKWKILLYWQTQWRMLVYGLTMQWLLLYWLTLRIMLLYEQVFNLIYFTRIWFNETLFIKRNFLLIKNWYKLHVQTRSCFGWFQ